MPDSQITQRPLATLTPWARNARTHSTKQIRQIDASSLVGGACLPTSTQFHQPVSSYQGSARSHQRRYALKRLSKYARI